MHLTDQISIASVDEERGTCKLALNGNPISPISAKEFDGTTIDGQYACADSRYLVCLSYGIGWDDALNIYLLDSSGKVLDAMTGGGLMSIGVFKARECGERTLDFTFFSNDTISRLTVSAHPGIGAGWGNHGATRCGDCTWHAQRNPAHGPSTRL